MSALALELLAADPISQAAVAAKATAPAPMTCPQCGSLYAFGTGHECDIADGCPHCGRVGTSRIGLAIGLACPDRVRCTECYLT
jgi:hypothetical protein